MSMAITTSAPISRTTSTGTLSDTPPSTRSLPSISTAEKAVGIAMLARKRPGEVAVVEHDLLAGGDVGGDGAERNRQVVEVVDGAHRQGEVAQHDAQLLAGAQSGRELEPLAADAELDVGDEVQIVVLAPEGAVLACRLVGQGVGPVDGEDRLGELVRVEAGGVEAADDRAHAGAGGVVDRDAHLLEDPHDADMSAALGAATGEGDADLRARRRGSGVLRGGRRGHRPDEQPGKKQCEPGGASTHRAPPAAAWGVASSGADVCQRSWTCQPSPAAPLLNAGDASPTTQIPRELAFSPA